jgi:hypothetical protein
MKLAYIHFKVQHTYKLSLPSHKAPLKSHFLHQTSSGSLKASSELQKFNCVFLFTCKEWSKSTHKLCHQMVLDLDLPLVSCGTMSNFLNF